MVYCSLFAVFLVLVWFTGSYLFSWFPLDPTLVKLDPNYILLCKICIVQFARKYLKYSTNLTKKSFEFFTSEKNIFYFCSTITDNSNFATCNFGKPRSLYRDRK